MLSSNNYCNLCSSRKLGGIYSKTTNVHFPATIELHNIILHVFWGLKDNIYECKQPKKHGVYNTVQKGKKNHWKWSAPT